MGKIFEILSKFGLRNRRKEASANEVEALRAAFKSRYHNFKLLLSANNKALEIMSELETALRNGRPFGMSLVKAQCTAVSVNVFRIVQNLDQLAPGKYPDLGDRFREIQAQINQVLAERRARREGELVVPFSQIDIEMADQVGSKMANVADIMNRMELPVPHGFVITSAAYRRFFEHNDLQSEIESRLQSSRADELDQLYSLSADIQQIIIRANIPEDLQSEILRAYHGLEGRTRPGVKVSMRSSALGEDSAGTSFAGQYRSELNVNSESLLDSYKEIVASKYSLQALAYRLNRGILDEDVAMCVGCMAMVDAMSGGVIYTRNPLNIRDESININSVWGLPKSVVDGSVVSDIFVVSRTEPPKILNREIRPKNQQFICYPEEGVCRLELTAEKALLPSLDDEKILELARIAIKLEDHYGSPQDIEWAVDHSGQTYVLQCRPLKQSISETPTAHADPIEADRKVLMRGGLTASPGVACGEVFVIRKNSESLLFPHGAVMVVQQALPRWAALLNRASAVITEQGSVAGHLANVAREFGVPALCGLPAATEILKTGCQITVDADGLAVYEGRVEELLEKKREKPDLMAGSSIMDMTRRVVEHIIPLHLLDPDSTEFRARNCRTLHDITRFSHEKSVKEMFNFGREHDFSERASKQLVCDVPMQWWVINLDDGFFEDVPGKFVRLDNIASMPMLALWEGIIAVPWEGPPPMDSKGFMSILMEATTNPALDPSMPSPYSNRNYFMLSRNFCSLSSRFGFHFSTIETLVGDRPGENYISFHFKGGAADVQRRIRRAEFLAGILEEYDFRAEVREDGVLSRIEGFDMEIMKDRLRILGYLIIHTRQLDMVLSNDTSYVHHRDRLLNDIGSRLRPPEFQIHHSGLIPT